MISPDLIGQLLIYMVVLLFAISAHEAAHAWMSDRFGDDTARLLGRVTLNPVAHTDPIGTLLIPIFNFIIASTSGGGFFLIGWGKPTPVNPLRWRNKTTANVMVSLAGILANLTIATCALVLIKVLQYTGVASEGAALGSVGEPVGIFLFRTLMMNASLAVFNLLPFPPLDGSKVLESFLPESLQPALQALERYGFIILLVLVNTRVFDVIFAPFFTFISYLLYL